MKKIFPIKVNKVWGYELWLHSPLKINQSKCEDESLIASGPLIKIIKTNDPLSVQVHPDDKLAKELENKANGKSECWFILEADSSSEYVVGISTINPKIIKSKIKDETFLDLLLKTKAKPKDFIDIPAGMVHGLGANIKVLEIQQPSDITYRFYDYNRLENGRPRELHIEKSLKAIKKLTPKVISNFKNFKFLNYKMQYKEEPSILVKDAIVIDLELEMGFLGFGGDEIKFKKYFIISI